jgi:hypothetical protein
MTEQLAYGVFLTIVFGGLALLTIALVAVFVVLVRSNLRARYPRLVRRRSPDAHRDRAR